MNELATYQANPLIEARKKFSVQESRLFYLGLEQVNPHLPNSQHYDETFKEVNIPTEKVIKHFGNNKWYYTELRKICRGMAEKVVEIKTSEKGFKVYPVFSGIEFEPESGLTITFNEKMKPWLLELFDKPFTKIARLEVWELSSNYAIRILELVLQYKNSIHQERVITIEDLRLCLNVPDGAYKEVYNFKIRVLNEPIEEINAKTNYIVSYESIKQGRRVTAFKFKLEVKDKAKEHKLLQNPMPTQSHNVADELANRGVILKVAKKMALEFDNELLTYAIRKCDASNPSNSGSWLYTAIYGKRKRGGWIKAEFEKHKTSQKKKIVPDSQEIPHWKQERKEPTEEQKQANRAKVAALREQIANSPDSEKKKVKKNE